MKRYCFLHLIFMLFLASQSFANDRCFIAKDTTDGKILIQEGNLCNARQSPASTFKIAISLMTFNENILIDKDNPKFEYKPEYEKNLGYNPQFDQSPFNNWLGIQTPKIWIKNSTVWYSQVIMKDLGIKKFKQYIKKFKYGNQDISGDYKKNNGLIHSWLSSSLKISPIEQLEFLETFLLKNNSIINDKARINTQNIFYKNNYDYCGWKFYGKTGSGLQLNDNQAKNIHKPFGWFIGFIEKKGKKIVFVNYLEKDNSSDEMIFLGKEAMEDSINKIKAFF